MAVHSLKPATDRRLGGPLPRQLTNQTRAHPVPPEFFALYHAVLCAYAVLAVISNCCPPVQGRLPTRYSPVRHSVHTIFLPKDSVGMSSFDLHVLSTPPAFILSQDQTLVIRTWIRSFRILCSFTLLDDLMSKSCLRIQYRRSFLTIACFWSRSTLANLSRYCCLVCGT